MMDTGNEIIYLKPAGATGMVFNMEQGFLVEALFALELIHSSRRNTELEDKQVQ